ncbi:ComF family protein [Microbulbifer sp. THAF38]|uniref:ComF family protein n=1 Tax=Microbulbifer sp. THAF38 TaxID=2587856 RepID=UPI0012696B1D|nr:phosphoribosyltransferase family protein [Microbulbifer sp. THAF38]QFT55566.1 adenine phosphoribosyltransferase [Microbulbifer sp. THAF38]
MSIEHLFDYHPYRGGNNPNHTGASAQLLKFKNGDPQAVQFFTDHVATKLRATIPSSTGFSVATVPSSTAGKAHKGFGPMIRLLKGSFPEIRNSGNLLQRISSIPSLHKGGNRAASVHQSSLVAANSIVSGEIVVLLDDVTTTGNSLQVAERLLQQAGANVVLTLALCKTV